MIGRCIAFATLLGLALTSQPVESARAAGMKVASGTIRSVDPVRGIVAIKTESPRSATDQTFRLGPKSVIAVGLEPSDPAQLKAGQAVTVHYDPDTQGILTLRVAVPRPRGGAAGTAAERTTRTVLRPTLPEPTAPGVAGNADYVLDVAPARSVKAVLTYRMTMPDVTASEWVLYTPVSPELPSQRDMKTSLAPSGQPARDLSAQARPLLCARVPADRADRERSVSARVEYEGRLFARHLRRRQSGEAVPVFGGATAGERQAALARAGSFDLDAPAFRKWMDENRLERGASEGSIDYARRVFLAVKSGFSYEGSPPVDRRASKVCTSGRSDCGGLALVFASALRSHGIPARLLIGRWALSARPGEHLGGADYYQWHVKSEFFAEGVGWVPADPSMALVYDRSREGLRYFGHEDGDFITMHVDPDVVLDTIYFGPSSVFCLNGGLPTWVTGSGSARRMVVRQDWQVREEAVHRR